MIKLIVENGNITAVECSTSQEAADYARLMQSNSGDFGTGKTAGAPIPNTELHYFFNKISNLCATDVSSGTLANTLNLSGVQGLGPKIRGIAKKYEAIYHRNLDDLIRREGNPGQESVWRINQDELKKYTF